MSITIVLLLGLTVGLPCTLLALAIFYDARSASRMPDADAGWYDEQAESEAWAEAQFAESQLAEAQRATVAGQSVPVAPSVAPPVGAEAAILELQRTVGELQGQLARQRGTLAGLLSDQPLGQPLRAEPAPVVRRTASPRATETAPPEFMSTAALVASVQQLNAEGLSERAIARRLRVGLEEVRLAGRMKERAS